MALAHYTNFGAQYAPSCADRDGFVKFNDAHVNRIEKGLAETGKETDGTLWVAGMNASIARFRDAAR